MTRKPKNEVQRFASRIPGLDVILGGGFFRSGVYIIQGLPGSGKTIFANQVCFGHVGAGGRAIYVTLLAESHARMLQHLRGMDFFDESAIPERLSYISAFRELEEEGLKGLVSILRKEVRAHKAGLLILDGLLSASETAATARELKKFVHEVQTNAMFNNCTVFLLTSGHASGINAERTMVDGLIELEDRLYDVRAQRSLQVTKFRGGPSLRGKHLFEIDNAGISVYPRIEALYGTPARVNYEERGLPTGIPSLDQMIRLGGLPAGSASVIAGSSGTGKTTLGLYFLSQCSKEEPGLHWGFFETPERLKDSARSLGFDLQAKEKKGFISFDWFPHGEHALDGLGHELLRQVKERGIKRLVIDGLSGFFETAVHPERIGRFLACLTNELRRRGVTTLMMLETGDLVSGVVSTPYGVSAMVDNMLYLRYVESQGRTRRLLSIIKVRNSGFDHGMREFNIGRGSTHLGIRHSANGDTIPDFVGDPATGAGSGERN